LQLTTTGSTNQTLYCQYIVTRKSAVRRTQQGNLPWNDFWTDRQTDRQADRQTYPQHDANHNSTCPRI